MPDDPLPIPPFSPARYPDTQSFLAIAIVAAFVGVIVLVIFHPPPAEQAATIFTLVGGLGTLAAGVGSFYFGSSKGSAAKDDQSAATLKTLVTKVTQNGGDKSGG